MSMQQRSDCLLTMSEVADRLNLSVSGVESRVRRDSNFPSPVIDKGRIRTWASIHIHLYENEIFDKYYPIEGIDDSELLSPGEALKMLDGINRTEDIPGSVKPFIKKKKWGLYHISDVRTCMELQKASKMGLQFEVDLIDEKTAEVTVTLDRHKIVRALNNVFALPDSDFPLEPEEFITLFEAKAYRPLSPTNEMTVIETDSGCSLKLPEIDENTGQPISQGNHIDEVLKYKFAMNIDPYKYRCFTESLTSRPLIIID